MCQTSVGQHDHELVEIAVVIEFLPKKAARLDKTQHSERLRDIEILLTNDASSGVTSMSASSSPSKLIVRLICRAFVCVMMAC